MKKKKCVVGVRETVVGDSDRKNRGYPTLPAGGRLSASDLTEEPLSYSTLPNFITRDTMTWHDMTLTKLNKQFPSANYSYETQIPFVESIVESIIESIIGSVVGSIVGWI